MTTSAHGQPRAGRTRHVRIAALITGTAAVLAAGTYAQRHRQELAILGEQRGVAADPQT